MKKMTCHFEFHVKAASSVELHVHHSCSASRAVGTYHLDFGQDACFNTCEEGIG